MPETTTLHLTKREQQVLDAIGNDWLNSDQIIVRVRGKKLYKRHLYSWIDRLIKFDLVERSEEYHPMWRLKKRQG